MSRIIKVDSVWATDGTALYVCRFFEDGTASVRVYKETNYWEFPAPEPAPFNLFGYIRRFFLEGIA